MRVDILAEKSRPDEETIIAVGDVLSPAAFLWGCGGKVVFPDGRLF